jgi:hypothetical protein
MKEESTGRESSDTIPLLLRRFHAVALKLLQRYGGRPTLEIKDEHDVQDLLAALLLLFFDDIRREEWGPSYAGKSTRADFLLKTEGILMEVKKTYDGRSEKQVGDELIVDIEHYRQRPNCKVLVCFVYDPEHRIANPVGFERDLSRTEGDLRIEVVVAPKA